MLRLASKLAFRPVLVVGGTIGTITMTNLAAGPIKADEGITPLVVLSAPRKLSIYPLPMPQIHLAHTESEIANHIGVAREYATECYAKGRNVMQGWVNGWILVEGKVENLVKEIMPKDEAITPGLLYVGVATLTGSVVGRGLIVPVRILLPPTALLVSLAYVLPQTFSNLSSYTYSLEHHYIPTFQHNRQQIQKSIYTSLSSASETVSKTEDTLGAKLRQAWEAAETSIGLKISKHPDPTLYSSLSASSTTSVSLAAGDLVAAGELKQRDTKDSTVIKGEDKASKTGTPAHQVAAPAVAKDEDVPKRLV